MVENNSKIEVTVRHWKDIDEYWNYFWPTSKIENNFSDKYCLSIAMNKMTITDF